MKEVQKTKARRNICAVALGVLICIGAVAQEQERVVAGVMWNGGAPDFDTLVVVTTTQQKNEHMWFWQYIFNDGDKEPYSYLQRRVGDKEWVDVGDVERVMAELYVVWVKDNTDDMPWLVGSRMYNGYTIKKVLYTIDAEERTQ